MKKNVFRRMIFNAFDNINTHELIIKESLVIELLFSYKCKVVLHSGVVDTLKLPKDSHACRHTYL